MCSTKTAVRHSGDTINELFQDHFFWCKLCKLCMSFAVKIHELGTLRVDQQNNFCFICLRRKSCSLEFWKVSPTGKAQWHIRFSALTVLHLPHITDVSILSIIFSIVLINASSFFWTCYFGTQQTLVILKICALALSEISFFLKSFFGNIHDHEQFLSKHQKYINLHNYM